MHLFAIGLRYYVTPNWQRVKDLDVWRDAAVQVFYSFGIGLWPKLWIFWNKAFYSIKPLLGGGGMITYASYNRFNDSVVSKYEERYGQNGHMLQLPII